MARKKAGKKARGAAKKGHWRGPYTKYGERIAALGLQRDLAKVLGVSQQTVSKKLRGDIRLFVSDLEKLSKRYKVPMTYFVE
jgi:transcriptional regulator with XRE-family HTH domain